MNQFETKAYIELGSSSIKAGYGDEEEPKAIINQSLTGLVRTIHPTFEELTNLKYPIQTGAITEMDDLEIMIKHQLNTQLKLDLKEIPLVVSYNPLKNGETTREALTEMVFEKFGVPCLGLMDRNITTLMRSPYLRMTGLVVRSGDSFTCVVPVQQGKPLYQHSYSMDLGGKDVSLYLEKLLKEKGKLPKEVFDGPSKVEHITRIKHYHCQIIQNPKYFEIERKICDAHPNYYEAGNEQIPIGSEKYECTEVLFQPSLIGKSNDLPLDEMILKVFHNPDLNLDFKKELAHNLFFSGENTNFLNMLERVQTILSEKGPRLPYKLFTPPQKHTSFGGSVVLSTFPEYDDQWMTKEQFEEFGVSIIQRKNL